MGQACGGRRCAIQHWVGMKYIFVALVQSFSEGPSECRPLEKQKQPAGRVGFATPVVKGVLEGSLSQL